MPGKPRSIDEVLAALPHDQRAALQKLRLQIRAAAPDAEECVSYGIAAFRLGGMLAGFGAGADHCAFYLMSSRTLKRFKDVLKRYDTGKGTIRFPARKPLPIALIRKLVKERIAENAARR
jgi:uncharacterized protein YdhG (YjbR/CyaY superfamily)